MSAFIKNYIERHQNRTNQLLHLVGVPLTFGVSIHWLIAQEGLLALAAFVGGYVLQFLGHAIEGNDAGEMILIKRMLGRPYWEFGPNTPQGKAEREQKGSISSKADHAQ